MKKLIFTGILCCGLLLPAMSRELHQGEKIDKSIMELEFDDVAKVEESYIVWDLVGDWDKFNYSFSQGECKDGKLTLRANEYQPFSDGKEGLAISLEGKSRTSAGEYVLSMKIFETSEDLEFSSEDLSLDMKLTYITPPIWKKLIVVGIILLAVILLLLLILHITAKFPAGLLQLNRDEVQLGGKKRISVRAELLKSDIELEEGTDVVLVKKRFASYAGPCIKEIKNCLLERDGELLSSGDVILSGQEIKGLKDIKGDDVIIRFC